MSLPLLTIASAAEVLSHGEIVAYPTDTFYGLGVRPDNRAALQRLVNLKRRDACKPISLILGRAETLPSLATGLTPALVKLVVLAWPGPLTVILPAVPGLDPLITGGTDTVAVRVPSHSGARILAEAVGGTITATSANRQGETPPVTADEVQEQFTHGLAGIVGGETTTGGLPSTLVRSDGQRLVILRTGAVSMQTLRTWWSGEVIEPDER